MLMRISMCLLAVALFMPVACSSSGSGSGGSGGMQLPDWVIAPPVGDGAFYGVGVASYQSPAMVQHAMDSATAAARNQLAASIRATVRSVSQRYSEQVLTAEGDISEEQLSREVSEQVVENLQVSGAIRDQTSQPVYDENTGLYTIFVRVKMDLNNVAEATAHEMARRVDQVRERGQAAFDELRSMTNTVVEEEGKTSQEQEPAKGEVQQ